MFDVKIINNNIEDNLSNKTMSFLPFNKETIISITIRTKSPIIM